VLCPSSVSDNAAFDNNKTRPGAGFLASVFRALAVRAGRMHHRRSDDACTLWASLKELLDGHKKAEDKAYET